MRLYRHVRHHSRTYIAALLGLLTYAVMPLADARYQSLRTIAAGDVFFGVYLVAMVSLLYHSSSELLRQRIRQLDETVPSIFILTAVAATVGLTDIFQLLHDRRMPMPVRIGLGIFTVVLAWSAMHIAAAFHYAHLFHGRPVEHRRVTGHSAREDGPDAGGLVFPGTETPQLSDLVYFSFVIGMTAQVSDVQVSSSRMRLFVLVHSIASFFFNAIILALAVNVAASLFA